MNAPGRAVSVKITPSLWYGDPYWLNNRERSRGSRRRRANYPSGWGEARRPSGSLFRALGYGRWQRSRVAWADEDHILWTFRVFEHGQREHATGDPFVPARARSRLGVLVRLQLSREGLCEGGHRSDS